ncbi:SDR family NAD(P)-dependent oxidoreductase [Halorussus sp. MSC15.2]|uniref:SDR family NAD(P)-dependent oxidoreductase n=1 Tax=Halorussus sp. MSC15.2 TaxID=2283638 RepID=UPI0013D5CC43|nr:SDR family NAD(P)-dependent oxidoreductase [Halorussus sp. MSC15.2]NEU56053.1 SDR family NAD(P)-dependent oxidoreductase [Halorussus sp. MSC15.2]
MDGQTAVVTGASRGIGEAVARRFAAEGARVVVCARERDALDQTVERIEADGGEIEGLRADVRDEYDVERLMETAARASEGGIDVVVACAGVYHGDPGETPLADDAYSAFDDSFRTNARGVFATVTEALPHLTDDARVLVPSGSVAREADAGYGSYAVSKAAAEAVVRQFAAEIDQTAGVVDPGVVATDLTGGRGRDPADAADLFRWAATDAPAEEVDGGVVGLKEFRKATA